MATGAFFYFFFGSRLSAVCGGPVLFGCLGRLLIKVFLSGHLLVADWGTHIADNLGTAVPINEIPLQSHSQFGLQVFALFQKSRVL